MTIIRKIVRMKQLFFNILLVLSLAANSLHAGEFVPFITDDITREITPSFF